MLNHDCIVLVDQQGRVTRRREIPHTDCVPAQGAAIPEGYSTVRSGKGQQSSVCVCE